MDREKQILIDYLIKNGFDKTGAELYVYSLAKEPEQPSTLNFNSILKIIKFTLELK